MTPAHSTVAKLDSFVRLGCLVVGGVGIAVLIGWVLNIPTLTSLAPGLASMKVNTACAFISASTALWLLRTPNRDSKAFWVARVLALLLIALAALTLAQDVFRLNLCIDQFLWPDNSVGPRNFYRGRMSPITSFSLVIVGVALLGLKSRRGQIAIFAHGITFLILFIPLLAIVGYIYGVSALYDVKPFNPIPVHGAITPLILALSIKAADPTHGIANIAASHTAGGTVCRRLLPVIPPVLIALGWLSLWGQQAGYYDIRFALAIMVSLSIAVCLIAILWTAYALRKLDITRERAESNVVNLNAGLKKLLKERTEQISQLSAALSANGLLEQQSLHDGLTGIANRRFMDNYLARQIAVASRHKRPLSFVLCDVDSFKSFNDHYGHQAGDACLKLIAAALQSCCQRPGDMAARYGGEEFALILSDTDLAGAARIAEACRVAVANLKIPHAYSSAGAYVSISGGIAGIAGNFDMTGEQLVAVADQSLYRAKREGRDRMICARAVVA